VCLPAAHRLQAAGRPGQPVGAEDEERDRVQPPVEHEHRGLAVQVVADRAAPQREVLVAVESG